MMNNKGFTLVELIAVLAILGTIALMAVPTITTSLNKEDKIDLQRRQKIIVSEVELKINKISDKLNAGCCNIASLKSLEIITDKQSKDKNGNQLTGGVKYNTPNHEVVYVESCNRSCR